MENRSGTHAQQAEQIIKKYAFGSVATGFIPTPWVDMMALAYVQRNMIQKLSTLYGVAYSKKRFLKTRLATFTSGMMQTSAKPIAGSLLKLIPGVGTLVGGASSAALGSAATYALGKVFQKHFEKGGTLENIDEKKMQQQFAEELEKGKEIAREEMKDV